MVLILEVVLEILAAVHDHVIDVLDDHAQIAVIDLEIGGPISTLDHILDLVLVTVDEVTDPVHVQERDTIKSYIVLELVTG